MGRSFGSGSSSGGSRSFGSGSFSSSRSFGSGSFGGSRSFGSGGRSGSRSFGSGSSHRPTFRWHPHTKVIFGRSVYLGTGRSVAVNLFTILLSILIVPIFICSAMWFDYQSDMDEIADAYYYCHQVAVNADGNPDRQIEAEIKNVYQYKASGKYYFKYSFYAKNEHGILKEVTGESFYIYDIGEVNNGDKIILAIDSSKEFFNVNVKTIPLDHKDMKLEDDAEYAELMGPRNLYRAIDIAAICLAVAGIIGSLVISLTAKKATAEQIAESNGTKATSVNGWRCEYCNSLNDATKTTCDGCGASRQK